MKSIKALTLTGALMMLFLLILIVPSKSSARVDVNGHNFVVRIASTQAAREQGLAGWMKLDDDQGMFFVFDKPDYYVFWMKGMLIPIDIIFITDGRIVDMAKNMQPPKPGQDPAMYQSMQPADSVLEVKAGTVERLGWKEGMRVK
ncbi:MAG: DUF192 domain-containing protein [Patescibacteria group bacterium]|nr:DUF192 domain-containing protein [Patescibacteria group bacterium]